MAAICFVTTCMGRLAALRQTLGPMLDQPGGSCVVVDYSCPDGAGDWVEANHPSVRVVRVPGQSRFNASAARNIGARHVDAPWICFVDSDVVLEPGFTAALLATLEPGGFYRVWSDDRGLGGTFACARSDFERVGGYDEVYPCWGEEDNDLYDALQFVGVEQRSLPARCRDISRTATIERTRFYPVPDRLLGPRHQPRLPHPEVGHRPAQPRASDPRHAPRPLRQDRRGRDGLDPDRPARRPGCPPPSRNRPRRLVALAAAHLPPDQGHVGWVNDASRVVRPTEAAVPRPSTSTRVAINCALNRRRPGGEARPGSWCRSARFPGSRRSRRRPCRRGRSASHPASRRSPAGR